MPQHLVGLALAICDVLYFFSFVFLFFLTTYFVYFPTLRCISSYTHHLYYYYYYFVLRITFHFILDTPRYVLAE